jgi:methyl-accepting chemotaxis protein
VTRAAGTTAEQGAVAEAARGTQAISGAITDLAAGTHDTNARVSDAQQAAEELARMSNTLREAVSRYSI